jgi:transposase
MQANNAPREGAINPRHAYRIKIQTLAGTGKTNKEIMVATGLSLKTIRRWRVSPNVEDCPRSGRPESLSQETKSEIEEVMRDKWGSSLRKTAKILSMLPRNQEREKKVTCRTIQRYVQSTPWGKVAFRPRKTFMLTQKNIEDRLSFCHKVQQSGYCTENEGGVCLRENILFTDESVVELFPSPNSQNMRIRTSCPQSIEPLQRPKHGLKIMVCGGITANGVTELHVLHQKSTINAEYYHTNILPIYFNALNIGNDSQTRRPIFTNKNIATFMQDGAPAHSANICLTKISTHFPNVWAKGMWPGNSPDLNPLENIWTILQDSIFISPRPKTRDELIARVTETWDNIDSTLLHDLCHSFPRRISQCIERNGRQTSY